ncbi:pyridoxamine 5'-phosphate oxidase [Alteromonas sp. 5E99-2]|uniref:pyridoxamine 5'-phosphate oxidase n=1 Tax=Alteromonas sp. 5E99-2 TaxID=2817683 RepID=UPI001A98ECAC|nr:pyridoxamine 5'-phosphate oxidase [Alteromonas sp. 5E99-2]MBO1255304.1 pyridoxamine 5'-phosphate oxidase [Alteromonas sp. 5E99-2]
MKLPDIRENYTRGTLLEADLPNNPLALFDSWLEEVIQTDLPDPNAMTLATVNGNGEPSQRIVLLKGRPDDKFVFYTNYESSKAKDIEKNDLVSLHFPWYLFERQVSVRGVVSRTPEHESEAYFSSRPKESQLGAFVSQQSQPLSSKQTLIDRFNAMKEKYADKPIPKPNWGGYSVTPLVIEFWQGGSHRLHDRIVFSRENIHSQWTKTRLNP